MISGQGWIQDQEEVECESIRGHSSTSIGRDQKEKGEEEEGVS